MYPVFQRCCLYIHNSIDKKYIILCKQDTPLLDPYILLYNQDTPLLEPYIILYEQDTPLLEPYIPLYRQATNLFNPTLLCINKIHLFGTIHHSV